jgi:Holliday junction resolvase RusA-like endonuclease
VKNKIFECTLPGKVGIKKNNKQVFKRHGKTIVASSDRFINWESIAISYAMLYKKKQRVKTIDFELEAQFEFHFKNRHALPDTSNCIEGPQDVLTKARVYTDDKLITKINAERFISGEEYTLIKLYKRGVNDEKN